MNKLKYTFLILSFVIALPAITNQLIAQNNCMEIPEIGGSTCIACAPNGWDIWLLTPDIVDGNSWVACGLTSVGTSPSGGNMIILDGSPTNVEGVSTEITGLTPGTLYNVGFYWTQAYAQCGLLSYGGGSLSVTIDGFNYTFSGADDWELAEICFAPSSPTIEIFVTIESSTPGLIVFDSAICEEFETCCNLFLVAEPEYEICPGVPLIFEANYYEETDNVSFEWDCDPVSGLNFLDDRFALNPVFEYPASNDFEGQEYIFTLYVTDDICTREEEVLLYVIPSEIPEFDIRICDQFEDFVLPGISDDGYTGQWQGDFDFENLGGTVGEYIFQIDPDQNNCIEESNYFFEIEASPASTFVLPTEYCQIDPREFDLPLISEESFIGNWDFDFVSPENLTPDFYTFNFYPDLDINCAEPYEYEFEITTPDQLTFQIPNLFCLSQNDYALPTVSLEGIQGSWNVNSIIIDEITTDEIIVFTPEDIADCYYPYEHQYSITQNLAVSFNIPDSLCRREGIFEFPTISQEGYSGSWNPAVISLDTIIDESISSTWTPKPNQSDCLVESSFEIQLKPEDEIVFNLENNFCVNSGIIYLDAFPNEQNIPGIWLIDTINTNQLVAGSYQYEFVPGDGYCYEHYLYEFTIVPLEYPVFNLPLELCASQESLKLPMTSLNGYSGSWTIPFIDPSSTNQGNINSTFIPFAGQGLCVQEVELNFLVDTKIDPLFDIPEFLCSNEGSYVFPSRSLNNIEGSWIISEFIFDASNQTEIINTFIPDDLECYNEFNISLELIRLDLIEIEITQTTDCQSEDGLVNIILPSSEYEYSLDEQMTWSQNTLITKLSQGDYTLFIRSTLDNSCIKSFTFNITDPLLPEVQSIVSTDIDNCLDDNGMIEILSNETNLEYSINEGVSWQIDNRFENLEANTYFVQIRKIAAPNCISYDTVIINDFEQTNISEVEFSNVTDCSISNGQLTIIASGIELEYSIDNGLNWQFQNHYDGLSPGTYIILARSSLANNCLDSQEVIITGPEYPIIQMLDVVNPSDCQQEDGQISIIAQGSNLEYSIDNGLNWQDSPVFTNLPQGNYLFIVREKSTQFCLAEIETALSDPEIPQFENIEIINPGTCFLNSGEINISGLSAYKLEFSIDGGNSFQDNGNLTGLSSGEYIIIIRPENFISCQKDTVIELVSTMEVINITYQNKIDPSTCISEDGSIELEVDISNCEYSIDDGTTWQTAGIFENLSEGNYIIEIRKISTTDCFTQFEFSINNPPCPCGNIEVQYEVNPINCNSANSGSIAITDLDGLLIPDTYSIQWSTGQLNEFELTNLNSGWYYVTIDYDKNCSYEEAIFIEPYDPISFDLVSENITCTSKGSIEIINYSGGNGSLNFSLDGNSFDGINKFDNLTSDRYSVYVKDQLGCMKSRSIDVDSDYQLELSLSSFESIIIGESIVITPEINPIVIDSFEWIPKTGITDPFSLKATFSPETSTRYTLTIYLGQCTETRELELEVIDNRDIYIGDIFSPNGDGNNDDLYIQTAEEIDVEIHQFEIFDRWGNKVFSIQNPTINNSSSGWDGYFNNTKAEIGVYRYLISYTLRGQQKIKHDQITLIR